VIYIQKESEPQLVACGDNLGDMTNELRPGEYIEEFVSGGPNNYAYRVVRGNTVCKIRGISLNYTSSQLVSFDIIRHMVLNGRPDHVLTVHTDKKIKRKKTDGGGVAIVTEAEDKIYRVSFFTRRRLNNNSVLSDIHD
jgi:hypothetical protein